MKKMGLISVLMGAGALIAACGGGETTVADLEEDGIVQVGVANEEPYGYLDGETATGASTEIARAVFQNMGVEDVEATVTEFGNLIPSLNAGNYDVVTAGMDVQPERCENASFGDIEYSYGEGMAVEAGNPLDLHSYEDIVEEGATVSVMSGANQLDMFEELGIDEDNIQYSDDIPGNIAALEAGDVDATVMTGATMNAAMENADTDAIEQPEDFTDPVIDGEEQVAYGAAVFREDDEELREAYNESLQELKDSGEIAEIIEEFDFDPENVVTDEVTTEELCGA
ncbi:ectoine/hydroxyectoine ABC transporter substrate-binding protein EhuB [Salicibibacter halophilus]|uniref:Ectoine/hydroxyectoine ABC transporter substrate-binding protein EhuB n=1 Tax=Salicibibacter halophilus TaxID=2502791 RepID=A0A514LLP0_9BACI|nr:ectoine/hydroxyectoine ABC transporter substrate-binding protein EhuB [Salicibibacter halophilus]QDI92713.1 ectoine/hydroxyectoine ABC transporter substrate-binding protein EhuB [Salicibibacter halophilus]